MLNTVNFTVETLIHVTINYFRALFSLRFGPGCVKIWVRLWVCVPQGRKVNSWSPITGTQRYKCSMNSQVQINGKIDFGVSCNAVKFGRLASLKDVLSLWQVTLNSYVRFFVRDFTAW